MIKKILMMVSIISPCLFLNFALAGPPTSISPFIHPYLGIGPALNMQFFQEDYLEAQTETNHWVNYGNYGASGHIYMGYNGGIASTNSIFGLDVHAQYNGTEPSEHRHNNIPSFHSTQLPWQFGISPKLGYVYNNNFFYIIAGPEWTQLKNHEIPDTGLDAIKIDQYQLGGLFGFGLSQNILPNLNIVEQFNYAIFQNLNTNLANGDVSNIYNPAAVTVMLALEYHFS